MLTAEFEKGRIQRVNGPPRFVRESLRIGMAQYAPGDWTKVTVIAAGQPVPGPGIDQGVPLIESTPPEDSTDMYYTVEFGARTEPTDESAEGTRSPEVPESESRRGIPQWDGEALSLDGEKHSAGRWTKVTVFPEGWATRNTSQPSAGKPPTT
jgi:hypothetical protein